MDVVWRGDGGGGDTSEDIENVVGWGSECGRRGV